MQEVLDCALARESFYLAFKFLELPMNVFKNWYLYRLIDSDNDEILVQYQRQ